MRIYFNLRALGTARVSFWSTYFGRASSVSATFVGAKRLACYRSAAFCSRGPKVVGDVMKHEVINAAASAISRNPATGEVIKIYLFQTLGKVDHVLTANAAALKAWRATASATDVVDIPRSDGFLAITSVAGRNAPAEKGVLRGNREGALGARRRSLRGCLREPRRGRKGQPVLRQWRSAIRTEELKPTARKHLGGTDALPATRQSTEAHRIGRVGGRGRPDRPHARRPCKDLIAGPAQGGHVELNPALASRPHPLTKGACSC